MWQMLGVNELNHRRLSGNEMSLSDIVMHLGKTDEDKHHKMGVSDIIYY